MEGGLRCPFSRVERGDRFVAVGFVARQLPGAQPREGDAGRAVAPEGGVREWPIRPLNAPGDLAEVRPVARISVEPAALEGEALLGNNANDVLGSPR
jgi:hypothetical protein